MAGAKTESDAGLAALVQARRLDLRERALYVLIGAAALGWVVGWGMLVAWVLIYAGLQGVEQGFSDAPLRRSRRTVLSFIFLEGAVYGALPLAAIFERSAWSMLCGGLFLAAAMLIAALRYPRSRTAYAAAMTPLGFYLVIAAGFAARSSGSYGAALATTISALVLAVAAVRLWRSNAQARDGQARMRAEAERRKREADAAAGARQAFVAAVSQELHAPLGAILASAAAVGQSADLAARADGETIAETAQLIRALLSDLADLSLAESGRMRLETTAFDLRALVCETADRWMVQARRKSLFLRLEGADSLPAWIRGDAARIRQILQAAIAHAVAVTAEGGVTLSVTAARLEPGESRTFEEKDWLVRFCIADTGPCFMPEQRARLFAPFDDRAEGEPRAVDLALARALARMMGGDLYAGGGTDGAARLTLEVGLAEAVQRRQRRVLGAADRNADLHALVVDDEETNRRAIALLLEPFGVRITHAASARAALEILASTPFDLVLMDVDMPLTDGLEACRRLRAVPGVNRATPVVACMTSIEPAEVKACRTAGMTAWVAKPIEAPALYAAVDRALLAHLAGGATAAA